MNNEWDHSFWLRRQKNTLVYRKLSAFKIYKEEGLGTATKLFPDLIEFIQYHKDKSYNELEIELLSS